MCPYVEYLGMALLYVSLLITTATAEANQAYAHSSMSWSEADSDVLAYRPASSYVVQKMSVKLMCSLATI